MGYFLVGVMGYFLSCAYPRLGLRIGLEFRGSQATPGLPFLGPSMGLMSIYYHPYHNPLKQAPGILRGLGPLKLVAWRVAYLLGVACVQAHMTNFRMPKSGFFSMAKKPVVEKQKKKNYEEQSVTYLMNQQPTSELVKRTICRVKVSQSGDDEVAEFCSAKKM
ncbi:hypothetical protein Pyn_14252 [Prunus yedoensis var. nudiflora]|uniref:Uncharacterized protein n=1 Tax=Prunus yedoensis var. nudiflora TaxID=2094558 RepID=A0A314XNX4_PRUYE|nr:hypothetical protein Pyn_14252 [Prunus yedoensis var. nudiflora]